MLLSTMLIGTVSTVNAATSTKKVFLLNAANWETPCAYCWDGSNENGKWPGTAMTKEGTKDGFDVYSFTPSTGYSNIIFNDNGNGSTQSAKFDYPITDNQMYNNYTNAWSTYSGGSGGSGGGSTEATYYLWTSESDNVTDANAWTSTELTYSNGSYVGNVSFPKYGWNYYFTINKSPNSVKESTIWSSENEVRENLRS